MPRLACMMLLLLAALLPVPSRGGGLLAELDTSTPEAAYRAFVDEARRVEVLYLAYRQHQSLGAQFELVQAVVRLGTQLFDLSNVPPATRPKTAATAVGYLADILVRLPVPDLPPRSGDPPPRWTLPGTEIRFVRLTEGGRAGDYVISAETLGRLPEFHARIMDQPPLRPTGIANWRRTQERLTGALLAPLPLADLPEPLQASVLGTPVWKLAMALLVDLAVLVGVFAWWRLMRRISTGAVAWKRHAGQLTVPLLAMTLGLVAHVFNSTQVNLGGPIYDISAMMAVIALYGAAAWAAWIACWLLAEAIIASPVFPDDVYDANLLRLLARVGSLVAAGGLLILGANNIGVPALGLLAGVSVGGIALALAAQSTVENLFGGVSIFADRPFRVGDLIRYGGTSGTVVAIGPRSSRIRASDGTVTTVPNADLAKTHITNLSTRDRWVFQQRLRLPRDMPHARIVGLLDSLQRRIARHPRVSIGHGWPRVRLVGVTETGIELEIAAQILTRDEGDFLETQQALILDVLDAVEHAADPAPAADPVAPDPANAAGPGGAPGAGPLAAPLPAARPADV